MKSTIGGAVTKPCYFGISLIDTRGHGFEESKDFLASCYPIE